MKKKGALKPESSFPHTVSSSASDELGLYVVGDMEES